jgi:hypothetical protein
MDSIVSNPGRSTQVSFDIRNFYDRLEPGNGKNKYVCPVCGGRNLEIKPNCGTYHCFTSDCDNAAIREALRPWAEVVAERGGNGEQKINSNRRPASAIRKKQPTPAPIPAGLKLLQFVEPAWDCPKAQPISDDLWAILKNKPPARYELLKETAYSYAPAGIVYRIEWSDECNPKGRDKTYRQSHLGADGKRLWKKGDKVWPAYRINEVVELLKDIPDSEPVAVLMLEGEPNVEIARSHGIAALTLQGSNWNDAEVARAVEALRATGKNITLVKLHDNDSTGVKKGTQAKSACDRLQFPCIVIDPLVICPNLPEKGDIREILDNIDADEFIRRLEEEIDTRAVESASAIQLQRSFEQEAINKSAAKNKLSMREAAEMAREILNSEQNELSANIKLEEVRQKAGISDYSWENKIIKPLKRNMDGERFKLELLGLLQMEDPVERCRQIALLAPKYSMGAGTIREAMSAMKQQTQVPKTEVLTLDDLFASESEAMEWLVSGVLPVGETVLLCALPKVGKSKLAIDLAFCVATGETKFLGQETKQGKVLLITPDASKQSLKHELTQRGFRSQDTKNLHVIPRWSIDQMAVLEAELENFRPDLVVIDSLKKITAGKEVSENSAEFADNIIALNDLLTRYRAAGILVHHANKGNDAIGVERARGSTAIVGACWGTWMLDRIPKPDPNNKKRMIVDPKDPKRILTAMSRDSEGTTLNIEFNAENNSWEFMGEVGVDEQEAQQQQSYRERITNVLRNNQKELSGSEIMELLGLTREQRGSVYSELSRMENKRLINSRPAPGDRRFNLYSLLIPTTDTVTVENKKPLPPPPPLLTVPLADYSSENHTQHNFEDSQQNSQQIVSKNSECDSVKTTESLTDNGIEPIVSRLSLSQGGEGVEQFIDAATVTPLDVAVDNPLTAELMELDAEKIRDIALVWWLEYYPEQMQTLITQMYGWDAPGKKYNVSTIAAWLETQDAVVRARIGELLNRCPRTE